MRARFINEFDQGREPKTVMKIGRRHTIELPNAFEIEGPFSNKEKAEKLLYRLDDALMNVTMECEAEGIYDDAQMDAKDDVVEEFMEEFRKLGYEYTEDWQ